MRSIGTWLGLGLALCGLSLACGPSLAAPTPTPAADAFAVVRATSEAAYVSGKAYLDRGDYLLACIDLDTAKTNDPDNRSDIQQALDQALQRCLTPSAETTASTVPTPQFALTIVVPTVPVAAPNSSGPQPSGPSNSGTPSVPASPGVAAGSPGAAGSPSVGDALVTWSDPQGRFSIGAPPTWAQADRPQSFVGTSVVEFRDPSGRAEIDVAVDTSIKAVSPELYAAGLELAMQQQVTGYAAEQVLPGNTAGNPSVRRVFTFTQRDAAGQDHQARAFQLTVIKGSTPYLITGTAPAPDFPQFSPTFDRIVESFRFS